MGVVDLSTAEPAVRRRREGMETPQARVSDFWKRMSPAAKRHVYIRQIVLFPNREPPVNDYRTPVRETAETTGAIKALARELGADVVGVAEYDARLGFDDAEALEHKYVVVFGMAMQYDAMADIGPRSQDEVHRIYYRLDDVAVRLTHPA